MDLPNHLEVVAALASERRGRFMVEAEHSRRLNQLARGRGDEPLAPRLVTALLRLRLKTRSTRITEDATMDRKKFDDLSRVLAGGTTRRQFARVFGVLGLTAVVGRGALETAEAARKKGKGKKSKGLNKVTLCKSGQTIRVAQRSLRKHLREGATRGTCPVSQPQQPACVPNCAGKQCGPDGCGGECGQCPFLKPICNAVTQVCETII